MYFCIGKYKSNGEILQHLRAQQARQELHARPPEPLRPGGDTEPDRTGTLLRAARPSADGQDLVHVCPARLSEPRGTLHRRLCQRGGRAGLSRQCNAGGSLYLPDHSPRDQARNGMPAGRRHTGERQDKRCREHALFVPLRPLPVARQAPGAHPRRDRRSGGRLAGERASADTFGLRQPP